MCATYTIPNQGCCVMRLNRILCNTQTLKLEVKLVKAHASTTMYHPHRRALWLRTITIQVTDKRNLDLQYGQYWVLPLPPPSFWRQNSPSHSCSELPTFTNSTTIVIVVYCTGPCRILPLSRHPILITSSMDLKGAHSAADRYRPV